MSRNRLAINWTQDMIATVRTERAAGIKWEAIAAQVGVSKHSLFNMRRKMAAAGITFPGKAKGLFDSQPRDAVVQWIRAGKSYDAVAAEIGHDAATVAKWARRLGVISRRARALQGEVRA